MDQQEVLPPFNTILHKKIHYDHRFIPSTVGSNQAFPADTASNTVYQESDNKERSVQTESFVSLKLREGHGL